MFSKLFLDPSRLPDEGADQSRGSRAGRSPREVVVEEVSSEVTRLPQQLGKLREYSEEERRRVQ